MSITTYKAGIDANILAKVGIVNSIPVSVIGNAYKDLADLLNALIGGAIPADYDTLLKISNKVSSIEALIGQGITDGDTLVNTITEILTVFATFPEGLDLLTVLNSKVASTDVANDLATTLSGKVLDARQGKALLDMITPKAATTYVDTQDAAITLLITNLKAGSTETIASLKTLADTKTTQTYVDSLVNALKNGSTETIASLATSINALNAIVGSGAPDGDAFVDTVAEILSIFSTYPEGVDLLTSINSRVLISNIVNTLTEVTSGKVLDGRQGKVLKDLIDANTTAITNRQPLLVSGVNMATINGGTLLTGTDFEVPILDEDNYISLTNIPIIPTDKMTPYNLTEHFGEGIEAYNTGEVDTQDPPQPIYKLRISQSYLDNKLWENIVLKKYSSWTGRHGETTLGINNMQSASGYQVTNTARTYTIGTFYGESPKAGFVSQFATAETTMGYRTSKTFVSLKAGFKMKMMMCVSDGATVSTAKMFNGLSENSSVLSLGVGANPSTIVGDAMLGYGNDGGDPNLSIIHGPAGAIIKTSLGSNFPAQMQDFIYLEIEALPNGTSATYRAFRIDRTTGLQVGAEASGTLAAVPSLTAELALQFVRANGATALALSTDICFVSFEFPTDQYLTGITL